MSPFTTHNEWQQYLLVNNFAVFINPVARQIYFVVPINYRAACVEPRLLKQAVYCFEVFVGGNSLYIGLYVVNHFRAIVKNNVQAVIR